MNYLLGSGLTGNPTPAGVLIELSVFGFFILAFVDAKKRHGHWLSTLLWGAVAGFIIECLIVKHANRSAVHYTYGVDQFLLHLWNVPLWIGAGWGLILYIATWTADSLRLPLLLRALVAGILAVNIDLSLEPVANMLRFWKWHWPEKGGSPDLANPTAHEFWLLPVKEQAPGDHLFSYFDVPFDNFVAWIAIVALYGFAVRWAFMLNDRYFHHSRWADYWVPPAAASVAGVAFWAARTYVQPLYKTLGTGGQLVLFAMLFVAGSVLFWASALRARRDGEANRLALAVVLFFHVLSLVLFVFSGFVSKNASLLIVIVMNLVVGYFAYAWAAIDTLFKQPQRAQEPRSVANSDRGEFLPGVSERV